MNQKRKSPMKTAIFTGLGFEIFTATAKNSEAQEYPETPYFASCQQTPSVLVGGKGLL